jgi:hypothetical protein
MKNNKYLIFMVLFMTTVTVAQENINSKIENDSIKEISAFNDNQNSTHLTFREIPIDGSIKNFAKQLEKQKFKIVDITDVDAVLTGRFAGGPVQLLVQGSKETVGFVRVIFAERTNWFEIKTKYDYVKKSLIEKYGEPERSIEQFSKPYSDGSGDELKALKEGKCQFRTDFVTSSKNGILTLAINSDLSVTLLYVDTENYRKLKEQAMKEY